MMRTAEFRKLRPAALMGALLLLALLSGCCSCMRHHGPPPPPPSQARWVDGPQGRLFVEDGGSGGLPVLFVHGLGGDHEVWRAELDHLRRNRRALAVDLRGFGRSTCPADGNYGIEAMAGDVLLVARTLGLKRYVLVGHSMGGAVAIAAAAQDPESVAGLVLADPVGDATKMPAADRESFRRYFDGPDYTRHAEAFLGDVLANAKPQTRAEVRKTFLAFSPEAVSQCVHAICDYPTARELERYPGPVLDVITDDNDAAWSLQNLVKGLPVVRMPGLSHWIMLDDPGTFARLVDGFLNKLS
ncbi:MAG: alpha/beta hydrolase [Acidobacteriota bacterium]